MRVVTLFLILSAIACSRPVLDEHLVQLRARADAGEIGSQLELARRYESGSGVPRDEDLARAYYRKAADGGSVQARMYLAEVIEGGRLGFESDPAQASRWLLLAALQENTDAQLEMSYRYRTGIGTEIDLEKSFAWLERAAKLGHPRAQTLWAEEYLEGRLLRRNDARAVFLIHAGARNGRPEFQALLGWMYLRGIGVPLNLDEASQWLLSATENGQAGAFFLKDLATRYHSPSHPLESIWQYEKALPESGPVRYPLRSLYGRGFEIPADHVTHQTIMRRWAEAGSANAAFDLAWSHYLDDEDYERALYWFRVAEEAGNPRATAVLRRLGVIRD